MAIVKLIEFAKEGKKSITGLVMLSGFPREEKPAREWFNYLFNISFKTINDLIEELNQMRTELDYLKKNGSLPDTPDVGGTTPPVVQTPAPDPVEGNIAGTWTVTQLTSPMYGDSDFLSIGNVVYLAKHSSNRKVKGAVMTWKQDYPDSPGSAKLYTSPTKDTDDKGEVTFTFRAQYHVKHAPSAQVTLTSPNNTTYRGKFILYVYKFMGGGGGGGNANQTE